LTSGKYARHGHGEQSFQLEETLENKNQTINQMWLIFFCASFLPLFDNFKQILYDDFDLIYKHI